MQKRNKNPKNGVCFIFGHSPNNTGCAQVRFLLACQPCFNRATIAWFSLYKNQDQITIDLGFCFCFGVDSSFRLNSLFLLWFFNLYLPQQVPPCSFPLFNGRGQNSLVGNAIVLNMLHGSSLSLVTHSLSGTQ